jgi:HEAT repeat protein
MRIRPGQLLVVVALVVLVGVAIFLNPSMDQPGQQVHEHDHGHDHDHEAEKVPQEEPKADLAQAEVMLKSSLPHEFGKGLEELQKAYATTRGPEREQVGRRLLELATSDPRGPVRASATAMLRFIDNVDPKVLINLAKADRDPEVRRAALMAMAQFPAGGEVEATLREFAQSSDPGVRSIAIITLTQVLASSGQAGNEQLAQLLGQYDNDASAQAAIKFSVQGATVLPVLEKTLYESTRGPQRQGAAMAIAMVCAGFNPMIDEFARAAQVTHRIEDVEQKADERGLKPLLWALQNDPYAPTREVAAQGLGYLGDERAARPLAAALQDPDRHVRRRAAAALITVPAQSVVAELAQAATKDSEEAVRRFAVEALGWTKAPEVVAALKTATTDKSAQVRRYAAIELGRLADPGALDALSNMLAPGKEPDSDVRWAAVVALGKLNDKRATKVLIECLTDNSPQVANSAERALQRLGVARRETAGFES